MSRSAKSDVAAGTHGFSSHEAAPEISLTSGDEVYGGRAVVLTLTNQDYYLPVAAHRIHPERLLLLDEHERWFIWSGGPGAEPLAIEPALGHWMAHRPELFPLPEPLM